MASHASAAPLPTAILAKSATLRGRRWNCGEPVMKQSPEAIDRVIAINDVLSDPGGAYSPDFMGCLRRLHEGCTFAR
jgi:hypothetical protein